MLKAQGLPYERAEPLSDAMLRTMHAHLRYYYRRTDRFIDALSDEDFCLWYADLTAIREAESRPLNP